MAERRSGFHIETLKIRVPGRDARDGQQAGLEVAHGLARRGPELLALAPRGVALGALSVRVPAPTEAGGPRASAVSSAVASSLSRAVARASRGSSRS